MKRPTIELEIAPEVVEYVRKIARGENCSVEAVLEDGLTLLFGSTSEVESQLDRLNDCTEEQLWAVIHHRLTFTQDRRIRLLMEYGREGTLMEQEKSELDCLLNLIDRQTLLRSRALLLLKERGHDIFEYLNVQVVAE